MILRHQDRAFSLGSGARASDGFEGSLPGSPRPRSAGYGRLESEARASTVPVNKRRQVRRLGHGSRRFQRKAWEHILGLINALAPTPQEARWVLSHSRASSSKVR